MNWYDYYLFLGLLIGLGFLTALLVVLAARGMKAFREALKPDTPWLNLRQGFNYFHGLPEKPCHDWAVGILRDSEPLIAPMQCPACHSGLNRTHFDYQEIAKPYGQFMVVVESCPRGHGHHVEAA